MSHIPRKSVESETDIYVNLTIKKRECCFGVWGFTLIVLFFFSTPW